MSFLCVSDVVIDLLSRVPATPCVASIYNSLPQNSRRKERWGDRAGEVRSEGGRRVGVHVVMSGRLVL